MKETRLCSCAKIKSIASMVGEKNASKVQDYENLLVIFYKQRSPLCEEQILNTLNVLHL